MSQAWKMPKAMLGLVFIGLLAAGCAADEEVSGHYEATEFVLTMGGDTVDVLAAGGEVEVTLHEDTTAEGRIFAPKGMPHVSEDDKDFEVRFGGTYAVSGNTVTFDHRADTFIREAQWAYDDGVLRTDYANTLTVKLQRQ